MTLYFLRHAIARDRSDWRKKDSDRPLTSDGFRKMRKVAKGMKRLKLNVDWILTSPYRRAYDTAAVVAQALKAKKKLKIANELISEGEPGRLVRHLALAYGPKNSLLLVGHEPYLTRLISVLIGSPSPLALDFKKGGLCKLSVNSLRYGRCATLDWWLPPKFLRRLA
jgi:phosphohistidine phosphatase